MSVKPLVLTCVLLYAAVSVSGLGIGADTDHYLVFWDGKLTGEKGTERVLSEHEYAVVSPFGETYALLSFDNDVMPLSSTVKVFDRGGRQLYAIMNSGASSVRLADSGAAVLVTMIGEGPQAKGHLDFYDASGTKTGSVDVGFPGDGTFFDEGAYYALTVMGDATYVYDMNAGEEEYSLPITRSIAAAGDKILLIGEEKLIVYENGDEIWGEVHNLYYPRMGLISDNGAKALIGCNHEVALIDMSNGNIDNVWEAPGDFGVTDIDASGDFDTIAVGLRTLDGTESVQVLDGSFKLKSAEEHKVARPSGAMPMVAVLDNGVFALGQGWQTTLKK